VRTTAEIEQSYDLQAGDYIAALADQTYADQKTEIGKKLASIIARYEPVNLLDAGTGEATTLVPLLLAMKVKPRRVLGFDISLPRLDIARKHMRDNGLTGMFIQSPLDAIPLGVESFDVVTTYHAIEPNRGREKEILTELLRVTRKALVMVEPSYELAHQSARARMDMFGYVKGLPAAITELGYEPNCELWGLNVNPENPAALIVVEK
jgi:ubiquinone/menaquinone biosynthesis C-methylase UbiE